jgi:hypothetical protein
LEQQKKLQGQMIEQKRLQEQVRIEKEMMLDLKKKVANGRKSKHFMKILS